MCMHSIENDCGRVGERQQGQWPHPREQDVCVLEGRGSWGGRSDSASGHHPYRKGSQWKERQDSDLGIAVLEGCVRTSPHPPDFTGPRPQPDGLS